MMTDLKIWLFMKRLAREKKRLQRSDLGSRDYSYNPIKKIALFFDTTIPNEIEKAKQVMNFAQAADKELRSLAYVESIENALHVSCPIYSEKQINWINIPVSMDVISFINYEADLLILLNPKKEQHKNYILALSKAKLKAGIANYDEFDQYYDLLLDVKDINLEDKNLFVDIFRTVINFT